MATYLEEDYPCSFCGRTDGEHANGCCYEDYKYSQDIKLRQEKFGNLSLLEITEYIDKIKKMAEQLSVSVLVSAQTPKPGPMYPEIEVRLVGNDGNAFFILGTVSRALRKAKLSEREIKEFNDEAMSGNYDNLLQVCMKWVTVL